MRGSQEAEDENRRLKQVVADRALDIQKFEAPLGGNLVGPSWKRAAVFELRTKVGVSESMARTVAG